MTTPSGTAPVEALSVATRPERYEGPIVDVHLHTTPPQGWAGRPNPMTGVAAPTTDAEHRAGVVAAMTRHRIVRAVLHGPVSTLDAWWQAEPGRFLVSPMLFEPPNEPLPSPVLLREGLRSGRFATMGEVAAQYAGVSPADPLLEPYWRLAVERDVPIGVHTGRSFAGIMYDGYPRFRLRFGSPLLLEEPLATHRDLRLYLMHAGEPWRQDTLAMMSMYPQLYMDIAAIAWLMPPPALHALLADFVARGLGKRIMFGTDQMAWPDAIDVAVDNVNSAPGLTAVQKADIFYNNAVTFFRLTF